MFFLVVLGMLTLNTCNGNKVLPSGITRPQLPPPDGCSCHGYDCSCCIGLDVPVIHLNETACVITTYLPKEIGIDLKLTLNNRTLIEEEVSLRNPPPLCVGIPHLHDYASLCVVLYNVTWSGKVGACLKIEVKFAEITIEDVKVGCFYYNDKKTVSIMDLLFKRFIGIFEKRFQHYNHRGKIIFDRREVEFDP